MSKRHKAQNKDCLQLYSQLEHEVLVTFLVLALRHEGGEVGSVAEGEEEAVVVDAAADVAAQLEAVGAVVEEVGGMAKCAVGCQKVSSDIESKEGGCHEGVVETIVVSQVDGGGEGEHLRLFRVGEGEHAAVPVVNLVGAVQVVEFGTHFEEEGQAIACHIDAKKVAGAYAV